MCKASIILPVYNSEEYIESTINSVLNQTYTNFELIIVNDGSTDKSDIICRRKTNFDNRIRYFYKENSGVSDTRNIALTYAKGDYITFIDSDDLYDKEYLEKMINSIEKTKSDLGICAYKNFNKKESEVKLKENIISTSTKKIIEELQPNILFNQIWNKIYKRKILEDNKILFNKELSIAEDLKFNIEYMKHCKKYSYINECLYKYRISTNGLGFKFRLDANIVKIDLVKELELFYNKNDNKDYIYKSYIKQYISYYARIIDKRNNIPFKNKIKEIEKINKSKTYENDISKALNSKSKKIVFISKIMLNKSVVLKIIIAKLAIIYDKYNKNKIFKLLK